jgi:HD-GYP domain-containing protein (c-di-GMP phosphodiesterase class II)
MNTFASLIDFKDPYTKDHSARVSYYSVKIARKLGLSDDFVRNIAYIALMHDCGKLLIEDDILSKPSKLTDGEYNIMKTHTTNGGLALENFTSIEGIKDGAMYHHERWDGAGYPKGLKGEEIPLCARIIAVADALDAMSSDRCYRKRLPKEVILEELETCAGSQFDPKIAELTIKMINSGEIDINDNKIRKDAN